MSLTHNRELLSLALIEVELEWPLTFLAFGGYIGLFFLCCIMTT
jgi:hypothetical protein